MSDGSVEFDLLANDAQFKATVANLGKTTQSQLQSAGKSMQSLGTTISKYVTAPMIALGGIAAKRSIDFIKLYESAETVFASMMGGVGPAKELYRGLLEVAQASTFSQESFLEGGRAIVAAGANAEQTTRYMQALTNANALYGGSNQDLIDKSQAFQRVMSKGKFTMMEVNSMQQAGIPVLAILANQYGVTRDEIQDMISKGVIPAIEGLDKLTDGMERGTDGAAGMTVAMGGMAEQLKLGTLSGALDSMNSAWRTFSLRLLKVNPTLDSTSEGFYENQKRIGQMIAVVSTLNKIIVAMADVLSPVTDLFGDLLDWLVGVNGEMDEATQKWLIPLDNVGGALGRIRTFLDGTDKSVLGSIGKWIVGLAAAGPALIFGGKALSAIGGFIGPVITKMGALAASGGATGKAFTGLLKMLPGVGIAFALLGAGFLEGSAMLDGGQGMITSMIESLPGLVNQIVAGIGSALQRLPDIIATSMMGLGAIIDAIAAALPGILAALVSLFVQIVGALPGIAQSLIAGFQTVFTAIVDAIPVLIPAIISAVMTLITAVVSILPTLIPTLMTAATNLLMAIVDAIPVILDALIEGITQLITSVVGLLPTLVPTLLGAATGLFTSLVEAVMTALPLVVDAVIGLVTSLSTVLPTLIPQLLAAAVTLLTSIVGAVPQVLTLLISAVIDLVMMVAALLPTLIPALIDGAVALLMAIVDAIPVILPQLLDAAIGLILAVVGLLPTLIPALLDAAVQLILAIVNAIPVVLPQLLSAIVSLILTVVRLLPTFIGALIGAAVSLFMAIVTAVPTIISSLISAVRNLITAAVNVLPSMIGQFRTAGMDLIMGLVNGIVSNAGKVVEAVKNAAKNALKGALSFLGIESPSKVFRDAVGKQIMAGWEVGITANSRGLIASVKDTASALVDAAATPNLYASLAAAPAGFSGRMAGASPYLSQSALGLAATGSTSNTTNSSTVVNFNTPVTSYADTVRGIRDAQRAAARRS